MATANVGRVPTWFWAAAGLGLLWNAIGAAFYLGHVGVLGAPFVEPPSPNPMPVWATTAFAIGVWGSVLGTIGLLMRERWARPVLWIALVALIVDWGWVFFGSGSGIQPLGIMVLVVGVLLALLGDASAKRGWLR